MNPTSHPLRIFGWKADLSGCGYYRIQLPLSALGKMGHTVVASPMLSPETREASQVIIGQRICKPDVAVLWRRLAKDGKHLLIYELDDNLFAIDPSNRRAYEYYMKPSIRADIISCIKVSDLVIVSSQALQGVVYKYNKNVVVIPNYISEDLLSLPEVATDKLTVGWAGSATHRMDFSTEAPGIRAFFEQNPDVRFHTVGADYSSMISAQDTLTSPWMPSLPEYYAALQFDIGLAPVKHHVFNASKSYLKALEYSALGIPVVASDYVTYRGFIEDGVNGYLANSPEDWLRYLTILKHDPDLRHAMGQRGKAIATQHTIEVNAWRYEQAIHGMI